MSKVSINVSASASSKGLKEDLTKEARRRGFTLSRLVGDVLRYAIKNREIFEEPLSNPRDKGGFHISTTVSISTRDDLNSWASSRGTVRSHLVALILEKFIEENLVDQLYSSNADDQDEDED